MNEVLEEEGEQGEEEEEGEEEAEGISREDKADTRSSMLWIGMKRSSLSCI